MQIQANISIKPYHTFGIEVTAHHFAAFNSLQQLQQLLPMATPPLLILGGGSNVLFTKPFPGTILRNEMKGITVIKEDENFVYVQSAAGEVWHDLVLYCIQHGYAGMENLSLIPGSVGASPIQNIGAYGVEVKDIFYELEAWHLEEERLITFTKEACAFGYRDSCFKHDYKDKVVILNVTFQLPKKPTLNTSYGAITQQLQQMGVQVPTAAAISQAVIHIRSSKLPDPKIIGNAGSFFKNPVISKFRLHNLTEQYQNVPFYTVDEMHYKIAAGWLIEQCGWKGYRKGDAGCNPLQALVLVNYGGASGQEIFDLSTNIITSVQEKFGITLEREVNIIPAEEVG